MRKNATRLCNCPTCGTSFKQRPRSKRFCSYRCSVGNTRPPKPRWVSILDCTICLRKAGVSMNRIPAVIPLISTCWLHYRWKEAGFNHGQYKIARVELRSERARMREEKIRSQPKTVRVSKPKRFRQPDVLEGLTFGRLTIVDFHEAKEQGKNKQVFHYWKCSCVCGGYKIALQSSLLKGETASCGCLKKDVLNTDSFRQKVSQIQRKRWDSDNPIVIQSRKIKTKIRQSMKDAIGRIKQSGGSKDAKTIDLLGCSINECKEWLEAKFKRGMTWENHGKKWEIDHVMPLAKFDLSNPQHRRMATRYTNLQPLWKSDNQAKSDKIINHQGILI